jgi:hypothetical protein
MTQHPNPASAHARLTLTDSQRHELAKTLGVDVTFVPESLTVAYVSDPKNVFGVPRNMKSTFAPGMIIA